MRIFILTFMLLACSSAARAYDMGDGMTVEVTAFVMAEEDVGYMTNSGRCYIGRPGIAQNEVQCAEDASNASDNDNEINLAQANVSH